MITRIISYAFIVGGFILGVVKGYVPVEILIALGIAFIWIEIQKRREAKKEEEE